MYVQWRCHTQSRLLVNHELNQPATQSSESLIEDMIIYIKGHGNSMTSSPQKSKDNPQFLHKISCQRKSDMICSSFITHAPYFMKKFVQNDLWHIKIQSLICTTYGKKLKTFKIKTNVWEADLSNKSKRQQKAICIMSEDLWCCKSKTVWHTGIAILSSDWHQLSLWCRRSHDETT